MEDLDARITHLSDLGRRELIDSLVRMAGQMDHRVRHGARARIGTAERIRSDNARDERDRIGRILFFLRHRVPATGATAQDASVCQMLAEKLHSKGHWTGEIPD